jgi:hypothetical protein
MAKVFAQADFIKGLRDRVELEFDAHSKLAVPFGGAAVDLTETLSAALASDEAVSYGLQMKHDMRQVGHGDAYEGEMAWWLLTHDAVLTLHLQAVTDDNYRVSTNVLVRRYPAAKLWHAEVREGHVQAPGAIRSHRDSCVLVLHFPGGGTTSC